MYKGKEMIYIKALTPIHAGSGDGLESVDMPIQREKHSNIPQIEASSLKGSIKHSLYYKFKGNDDNNLKDLYTIFGPEEGEDHASSIGFTDARLLLFPVKSAADIFKLVTCPYIIKRWMEDLKLSGGSCDANDLFVNSGECISSNENEEKIILEEYIFEKSQNLFDKNLRQELNGINGVDVNRVVILNDSDFIDLVTMYTEIITRNKIDVETGAAKGTGLFTEEYLPAETIMYFMVLGAPSFDKNNSRSSEEVLKYFNKNVDEVFQIGGDATIGKGFVRKLCKAGE